MGDKRRTARLVSSAALLAEHPGGKINADPRSDAAADNGIYRLIEGEEGAYGVTFPDLPGVVAMAETLDQALVNAEDALRDYAIETDKDGRARIPPSAIEDVTPPAGSTIVSIPLIHLSGRSIRANMILDERVLAFIDGEAKRRGMTRTGRRPDRRWTPGGSCTATRGERFVVSPGGALADPPRRVDGRPALKPSKPPRRRRSHRPGPSGLSGPAPSDSLGSVRARPRWPGV